MDNEEIDEKTKIIPANPDMFALLKDKHSNSWVIPQIIAWNITIFPDDEGTFTTPIFVDLEGEIDLLEKEILVIGSNEICHKRMLMEIEKTDKVI